MTAVFDPADPTRELPVPDDPPAWVRTHPGLEVLNEAPAQLGGASGTRMEVAAEEVEPHPACYEPCVPLVPAEDAPYALGAGADPVTLRLFEVDGRWLVYTVYEERPGFHEKAEAVLESITF